MRFPLLNYAFYNVNPLRFFILLIFGEYFRALGYNFDERIKIKKTNL